VKYKFIYDINDKTILEYETNNEPPRIGEYVQLHTITDDKISDTYTVVSIYYIPQTPNRTNILIGLEIYSL